MNFGFNGSIFFLEILDLPKVLGVPWSKKIISHMRYAVSISARPTSLWHKARELQKQNKTFCSFDYSDSFTSLCVSGLIFSYLASNLHDLRGRWVAYSLICRQNKYERNPSTDQRTCYLIVLNYVHNKQLIKSKNNIFLENFVLVVSTS